MVECSVTLLAKTLEFQILLSITASFGLDYKEAGNLYRKQIVKLCHGIIFIPK